MTIKRTSDASQKLEDLVPNTIEVIDELDGLEGLEVDPNKIYWLKGTPESTRKSLLMLYEEPIQGNYFYEITPYESRFEVVFDLAEKVMSSRGMGAGHIALDTLSELKYLKERKKECCLRNN